MKEIFDLTKWPSSIGRRGKRHLRKKICIGGDYVRQIDKGDFDNIIFDNINYKSPSLRALRIAPIKDRYAKMKELQHIGYQTLMSRGYTPNELVMLGRYGEDIIMPAYNLEQSDRDYCRELGVIMEADTSQARGAFLGLTELMCTRLCELGLTPVYKLCWQKGKQDQKTMKISNSTPFWMPILASGVIDNAEMSTIMSTGDSENFRVANSSIFWAALYNYVKFCARLGIDNPLSKTLTKSMNRPRSNERHEISSLITDSMYTVDRVNLSNEPVAKENLALGLYAMGCAPFSLHRDLCSIVVPTLTPLKRSVYVGSQHCMDVSKDRVGIDPSSIGTAGFDLARLYDVDPESKDRYNDDSAFKCFGLSTSQQGVLSTLLSLSEFECVANTNVTNRRSMCVIADQYDEVANQGSFVKKDIQLRRSNVDLVWSNRSNTSLYLTQQRRLPKSRKDVYNSCWNVEESGLVARIFVPGKPWCAPNGVFYAASPYSLNAAFETLRRGSYSRDIGLSETLSKCVRVVQSFSIIVKNMNHINRLLK